jgi:hypothetical protein
MDGYTCSVRLSVYSTKVETPDGRRARTALHLTVHGPILGRLIGNAWIDISRLPSIHKLLHSS